MILEKTALGLQVMKDRSVPLTPAQRSAFILVDGKRTADEILRATAGAGVRPDDLTHLIAAGVVAHAQQQQQREAAEDRPRATPEERFRVAYPLAVSLTSGLGLRGVRLNLAVETARNYDELVAVAAKIKESVGDEAFEPLRKALKG